MSAKHGQGLWGLTLLIACLTLMALSFANARSQGVQETVIEAVEANEAVEASALEPARYKKTAHKHGRSKRASDERKEQENPRTQKPSKSGHSQQKYHSDSDAPEYAQGQADKHSYDYHGETGFDPDYYYELPRKSGSSHRQYYADSDDHEYSSDKPSYKPKEYRDDTDSSYESPRRSGNSHRQYRADSDKPSYNRDEYSREGSEYKSPNRKYSDGYEQPGEYKDEDYSDHKKTLGYETPYKSNVFSVGLWGDLPYSVEQVLTGTPNIIASMNSHDLAFTVYDGDWKAGTPVNASNIPGSNGAILDCRDELYTQQIAGFFNNLTAPAIYAPGDNEWTDCDKNNKAEPNTTTWNSLNRLSFIRKVFFSDSYSLGQKKIQLEVQTDTCLGWNGTDPNALNSTLIALSNPYFYKREPCSENRRWHHKGVTFVTVNMVGSCNNLCKEYPDRAEYEVRQAANLKWLNETFAAAKAMGSAGIMIIAQASPGFDTYGFYGAPKRDPLTLVQTDADGLAGNDGFKGFLELMRVQVKDFKRPVLFVHGDDHHFVYDKPLQDANGIRLMQFTRVQTFGDQQDYGNNEMNWVKVIVDPASTNVFTIVPVVVRANNPGQFA